MTTRTRLSAAIIVALLALAGCSDDDDDVATNDPPTTAVAEPGDATTGSDGDAIEVQLVDYRFEGLPERVDAGTTLSIRNASAKEVHELVAFRLADTETRSLDELLALPEEESNALFAGEPAAVLIARPNGGEQIDAVGDGTLTEPGRYIILCAIGTGTDPDEYFAAFESATEPGPVELEGVGPPHFMAGMVDELFVD